jgi:hypothetical protein
MLRIIDARYKAEYAKTHRVAYLEECKQNKEEMEHRFRLNRLFLLYNEALVAHLQNDLLCTFQACITYLPASYERVIQEFAENIARNGHRVEWIADSDEVHECSECSQWGRGFPVNVYTI